VPGMEPISDDLKELVALFKSKNVEFLVVGAHALAFHGFPRATFDLDLWIRQSAENIHKVRVALDEFGFPIGDAGEREFQVPRKMLVIGVEPHQVDVLAFLDGCDFDVAWSRREQGELSGVEVEYLSLKDYIQTKTASGRPKDLSDLERLREIMGSSFDLNQHPDDHSTY